MPRGRAAGYKLGPHKPVIGTAPDGRRVYFGGTTEVRAKLGIPCTNTSLACRNGKRTYYWAFEYYTPEKGREGLTEFTEDMKATARKMTPIPGARRNRVSKKEEGELTERRIRAIEKAVERVTGRPVRPTRMPYEREEILEKPISQMTRTLPLMYERLTDGYHNVEEIMRQRKEADLRRAKEKRLKEQPHYTGYYNPSAGFAILPVSGMVVPNNVKEDAWKDIKAEVEGREWCLTIDYKVLVSK